MNEQRIYIIGASGTGKTTLAKAIAVCLGLPHFDSDDYFHFPTDPPFQKQRSPAERAEMLSHDLGKHVSWVLSGGAGTWVPKVELDATLVVFLYLPVEIRLARLRKRESQLYGSRLLPGGDMEEVHQQFMQWTAGYDDGTAEGTNTLPAHEAFLANVHSPLRLETSLKTEDLVQRVLAAANKI